MLLAGCYERFLFGYRLAPGDEDQQLERAFTHAAHKGVVKCAAAAGPYAATGGADDLIHLYDLKNDKDLGFLMSPGEGAVTALTFYTPPAAYKPSHLLTGAADGTLTVWSVGGGWEAMKVLRGHRKEVGGIAVHPSGMLALTVGRDGFLRMWDLVKGRCTYTTRLEAEAEAVSFCQEDGGARYALLAGQRVSVHSVAGEGAGVGLLASLAHPRRALCMAWAPGGRLLTGSEDGSLRLWDAEAGTELLCINRAHASRVRALALVPSSSSAGTAAAAAEGGEAPLLVATASTDGSLKLWDLSKAAAAAPGASGGACLAEAQTRARLTCLAAADSPAVMQQRMAAAAAARQQAAKAAAAQQPQQQGQGKAAAAAGGAGKKRKADDAAAARPAKAAGKAPREQQQQSGGKAGGKAAKPGQGGKAGGQGVQGGPAPAADAGVRVHGGVVEFLDSPDQQKKQKAKQRAVELQSRRAAEAGKRFRSLPGEPKPKGQGHGGGGRGRGGGRGGARGGGRGGGRSGGRR